ncbi:MAG TPA: hypothetical protein PLP17_03425 [Oligoflexia bacterium]|nr:hypothetical protein [Oligoflexia bacterium]
MKQRDLILVSVLGGLVVILFVGLVWALMRPNKAPVRAGSAQKQTAAPAAPAATREPAAALPSGAALSGPASTNPVLAPKPTPSPALDPSLAVAYSAEEQQIGLRKKALKAGSRGTILHFQTTAERRCQMGDVDIIAADLAHSPSPRLILTLESLIPNDANFQPIVNEVTTANLKSGYIVSFLIPEGLDTLHLGLFLCSDSQNENRCFSKNKLVEDLNTVQSAYDKIKQRERYQKQRDLPVSGETVEAADRVYFFNYLLISGEVLSVIDSTTPKTNYDKLRTFLGSSASRALASEITAQVERFNNTLRSMPVNIQGRDMKLNFPVFDMYECPAAKKAMKRVRELREEKSKQGAGHEHKAGETN